MSYIITLTDYDPKSKTHIYPIFMWDIFKKPLHITDVEAIMSKKGINPIHHA
jgi:hypothetical protein